MTSERRRKLASLSFGEKLELLELLRDRSLLLAEARKKLARKKDRVEGHKNDKTLPRSS